MRKLLATTIFLCITLLASGCVYQAALSQGNLLKQEDIDQVEVGMTRNQVRFLLGTPMIESTFKRWISIFFDDQTVTEIFSEQELSPDL